MMTINVNNYRRVINSEFNGVSHERGILRERSTHDTSSITLDMHDYLSNVLVNRESFII